MSIPKTPPPGIIFVSFLYRFDLVDEKDLIKIWQNKYSDYIYYPCDFFPMKHYYSKEMGAENLMKRFFLFKKSPVKRDEFVNGRLWGNEIENNFSDEDKKRSVNLDTGILTLENVQLSTGKNFTHRIYLRNNIYSDLTLIFQKNSYTTLPWSYEDYAHPDSIKMFNEIRQHLHKIILEKN